LSKARKDPKDVEMVAAEPKEKEKEKRSATRINTTEFQKSTNLNDILDQISEATDQVSI